MNKVISILKGVLSFLYAAGILLISQFVIGLIYQYSYVIKWSGEGLTDIDVIKTNLIDKCSQPQYVLLVSGVSAALLMVIYGIKYYISTRNRVKKVCVSEFIKSHKIILLIILLVGFTFVWKAAAYFVLGNDTESSSNLLKISNISLKNVVPLRLLIFTIAVLVEELIFHGLIFKRMRNENDVIICNLVQSTLIGFFQFDLKKGIFIFTLAFIIGFVMEKTNSVLFCFIMRIFVAILIILESCIVVNNMQIAVTVSILGLILVSVSVIFIFQKERANINKKVLT